VLALLFVAAIGCGGAKGNRTSGKVTFKGQPVLAGKVYITPDSSKGNSGPAGYANISNGTYDTSAPGGKGGPTGAVIFSVEGIDPNPSAGSDPDVTMKLLFSGYQFPAELSGGSAVQDIDVPDTAAAGPAEPQATQLVIP
jgi:hypothetical protein